MKEYFVWLAKLVTLLLLIFIAIPLLLGAVTAVTMSLKDDGLIPNEERVAVIELVGLIDSSKEIVEKLQDAVEDASVKGIVLRINSPGGAVGPSQDLYVAVKNFKQKKPIIASMAGLAASGGLYAALGATKIYAQPGTLTGSIGVIAQFPNLTKLTEKVGLDMITVKSGKLKDVGNSFRPMSDDERAFLESTIAEVHGQFVQAVIESRGLTPEAVKSFADGRVLLGSQAKALGVIDDFGGVIEAARAVYDASGQPLAEGELPTLYYPQDKFSDLKRLLGTVTQMVTGESMRMQLQYVMP